MTYDDTLYELERVRMELERVTQMTEDEVREAYNADSKAEIIEDITEEIAYLERMEDETCPREPYDPVIEIFGIYEAMYY